MPRTEIRKTYGRALAAAIAASLAWTAQAATDWGQVSRVIQGVGDAIQRAQDEQDQQDARDAQEQQRQEAVRQQRERAQAQRQQQIEQAARQVQQQEWAALAAPPAYAGRIVVHQRLLAGQQAASPAPDFDLTVAGTVAVSEDGAWIAYETMDGRVTVQDTASRATRVVGPPRSGGSSRSLTAVANQGVIISEYANGQFTHQWVAWDGRVIRSVDGYPRSLKDAGRVAVMAIRNSGSPTRCQGVSFYDAQGAELGRIDAANADGCGGRADAQGRMEVLVVRDGTFTLYQNGTKVREFSAGSLRGGQYTALSLDWLGSTPYFYSSNSGDGEQPIRIWDSVQGRMLCEFPGSSVDYYPLADKNGPVYLPRKGALLSLPGCQLNPVGTSGEALLVNGDLAFLYNVDTGQVRVMEVEGWRPRTQFTVAARPGHADDRKQWTSSFQRMPGQPDQMLVSAAFWKTDWAGQVFDLRTGELRRTLPPGFVVGGMIQRSTLLDGTPLRWRSRLWKLAPQDDPQITGFLAAIRKDKFETTADFQKRVAALSMPYTMKMALRDYDADRGVFDATWRGMPVQLPIPPAQARQFDGAKDVSVSGDLRVLDDNFLELRNASATVPGGQSVRLSLPTGKPPVPRTPPLAMAAAQDASAASGAGSAARGGVRPSDAAAGASCTTTLAHLAPQMRAYAAPELSQVRSELLGTQVTSYLSGVRAKGGTAGMLLQKAEQSEQTAREAATTANQTDGRGDGVSIRQADNGTLPLNWRCEGAHSSAVCAYIMNRWEALATREMARQFPACGG